MWETQESRPDWDEDLARELLGSIILVGLTCTDPEGNVTDHTACFGMVTGAHRGGGVEIECHGERAGEMVVLPPVLEAFNKAAPGRYELLSGEVVVDPDYLTTWTARVLAGN